MSSARSSHCDFRGGSLYLQTWSTLTDFLSPPSAQGELAAAIAFVLKKAQPGAPHLGGWVGTAQYIAVA